MGESAVLVHSYSFAAPITRNESHEENAMHALSQSVSFGKFMTENLEWGKWSSFSHKKYVEEAEKYSRPGSVAQKKAFFEAHYKRIAEAKKAATQEQPTITPAQVLLHTLETQPPPPPPPPPPQPDVDFEEDEHQRKSSKIGDVDLVANPLFVDDLADELEEKELENGLIVDEEKEKKQEDDKEKTRRSMTKNKPVFRLPLEKTIPAIPLDAETEIGYSEKISEKPIIQSSETNEENQIFRQKFSLLNCFMGNAKTQDQNQSRKKRKTEKKKQKKPFLFLCLKPKTIREP